MNTLSVTERAEFNQHRQELQESMDSITLPGKTLFLLRTKQQNDPGLYRRTKRFICGPEPTNE